MMVEEPVDHVLAARRAGCDAQIVAEPPQRSGLPGEEVLAAGFPEGVHESHPGEGGLEAYRVSAERGGPSAAGGLRRLLHHLLEAGHHRAVVAVGFVKLELGELRGVGAVDALVPEVLAELVDPVHAARQEPLEVQLRRYPEVESLAEMSVLGLERLRRGSAVERLEDRSLDLDEAVPVQIGAQGGDDPRSRQSALSAFGIDGQVDAPVPVHHLRVGEGVEGAAFRIGLDHGEGPEALAQEFERRDLHGQLAGPGSEHRSGHPDDVAQIEQLREPPDGLGKPVLLQIDLDRGPLAPDIHEDGLPVLPPGPDPPGGGDGLLCLAGFHDTGDGSHGAGPRRIGVQPQIIPYAGQLRQPLFDLIVPLGHALFPDLRYSSMKPWMSPARKPSTSDVSMPVLWSFTI